MALNGSNGDIMALRREHVAQYRLRQMSMREIVAALAEIGIVNPKSGKPYTHVTIKSDLDVLNAQWRDNAAMDTAEHKANQLAEIAAIKREAWRTKDPALALRALETEMKLTGTLAAIKVDHRLTANEDAILKLIEHMEAAGQKPGEKFEALIQRYAEAANASADS